jgi:hypothetical protein
LLLCTNDISFCLLRHNVDINSHSKELTMTRRKLDVPEAPWAKSRAAAGIDSNQLSVMHGAPGIAMIWCRGRKQGAW